jgi:hypothetical protein
MCIWLLCSTIERSLFPWLRFHSAIGVLSVEDAADLNGAASGIDEEEAVVADAQPQFFPLSLQRLNVPEPDSAKRWRAERMRVAVGLSRRRTSAAASSVQTIRFTPVPCSCRLLPE